MARLAGLAARSRLRGRAWRGGGGRAGALAGRGANSRRRGRLAGMRVGFTSSTYIRPWAARGYVWSGNAATPAQTARGITGTGCQLVDGSELAASSALYKPIQTANAPELPNRTWVSLRDVVT